MFTHRLVALAVCSLASLVAIQAQETAKPDTTVPQVHEISPGVLEVGGKLRIDKKARSVSFPGKMNNVSGLLEYLIVTPSGGTHESLLVAEIQPSDLHFAMLLLGAKGSGIMTPSPKDAPP